MATPLLYILSLHDALPIYSVTPCFFGKKFGFMQHNPYTHGSLGVLLRSKGRWRCVAPAVSGRSRRTHNSLVERDRKSTRLNSSHLGISYAVFCLKKKKKKK